MSYTRRAFWGFAWITAGAIVANLFGYLLRLLLARNLTVAEYGTIYSLIALFGLVAVFNQLGLTEAITRYVAKYSVSQDDGRIASVIVWSLRIMHLSTFIVALIAFSISSWLATAYFRDPGSALLIQIFALGILFPGWHVVSGTLAGIQRMDLVSAFQSFHSIFLFALTYFLLRIGGIVGAVAAYPVLFVTFHIAALVFLSRMLGILRYRVPWSTEMPKRLISYSLPVMLTSVAGIVLTHTDTVLITVFSNLDEVGLYQAALPTANILLFFKGVLTVVLLPIATELWERKRKKLLGQAVADLYGYAYMLFLPLSLAVIMYPDIVLNLLFGKEYIAAAAILQILAVAGIFLTLSALNSTTLSGMGIPKEVTKIVLLGAAVNFLSNLYLIPRYGGVGAATSTLFSSVLIFVLGSTILSRRIRLEVPVGRLVKTTLSGAGFLTVIWASRLVPLGQIVKIPLAVMVAGLVYAMLLLFTRTITIDELKDLQNRVFARSR